jgi:haloacetate dehalogenase
MSDASDLPDLFPGFEATTIDVGEVELFCRIGGDGPPLLLVHGFPQTHVEWHRLAPALAEHFQLVLPDLRGYGASSVPDIGPDPEHRAYSKRVMAQDMVNLMETLGHARFAMMGHDRGARVSYRLALDDPDRISRLALLDIVSTYTMWTGMDRALAMKVYHWLFLAQPAPVPETLIGANHRYFLEHSIASWTKARDLTPFDPDALAHYRAFFSIPERLHATCEDYRAGATIDLAADEDDRRAGRQIDAPTLVLWGSHGIPSEASPLHAWRDWCRDVDGHAVDCGHFLPEENPEATLAALVPFLTGQG